MREEGLELLSTSHVSYLSSSEEEIDELDYFSGEDLITKSVRQVFLVVNIVSHGFLLSYCLFQLHSIWNTSALNIPIVLFAPMFVGSMTGVFLSISQLRGVCRSGLTLISRERRLFMIAAGKANEISDSFIDYESLPLMRKYFMSYMTGIAVLLCATFSEFLLYGWVIQEDIHLWTALSPMLTVACGMLVYLVFMTNQPWAQVWLFLLLLLDLLLFIEKSENHTGLGWASTVIPSVAIQICLLWHLLRVSFWGGFILAPKQRAAACMMTCSLLLFLVADAITTYHGIYDVDVMSLPNSPPTSSPTASSSSMQRLLVVSGQLRPSLRETGSSRVEDRDSVLIWLFAVILFTEALLIVASEELTCIADCRGFVSPIALSRGREGWGPASQPPVEHSPLLGLLHRRPVTIADVIAAGIPSDSPIV